MSKAKTLKEVLVATQWILEHMGWHQGCFYLDKNGNRTRRAKAKSCCLGGALNFVKADKDARRMAGYVLESMTSSHYPLYMDNIAEWNDAKGRTKAQVLTLVKGAIKRASI